MKVEGWLFLGCGIFFAGSDIVYWYVSKDPTGTVALAFAVGLAVLAGFYVLFTGRRLPKRPEDDNEGEIEQGTGELGFFSPYSWWPLFVALAARGGGDRLCHRLVAVPDRRVCPGVRHDRFRLRVLPRELPALTCTDPH